MPGELRVLVAEDNPEILELLRELLEAERCRVTLCSDGASALARIAGEPFHLILSDITMPGVSGLEILDRSNAMAAGTPVVLISGNVDVEAALFALRRGAFDCLLKPFCLEDIRDLIRRVQGLNGLTENGVRERVPQQTGRNGHRPQEILIRKSRALQLIARSGRVLGEVHDLGGLMGAILDLAMRGAGAEVGALLVISDAGDRLQVAASSGFSDTVRPGDEVRSVEDLWTLGGLPSENASSVVPLTVKARQVGAMALANRSLYATLESSVFEGMRAMVAALEAKDPYTGSHSLRVAGAAVQVCRRMGLESDVEDLVRYAGALHDIGKVGIPDVILQKPGKLTPDEYERMKAHSVIGWKILMPFSFLQEEAVIVRHNHEWMNGKGYPDGLVGSAIPLAARILAVADAYDTMTTARPYRSEE